ncbi:acylneuraminate cytidylyltransferase [Candidatus Woesearchaeota archaeon B3_Woes]|nr:MAG: acylneuraminate cytidylyltransferase [Candidatus Woesearchaeota archaeon B3_Woes]
MKIVAIIQARMGSSRLPGKMMKLINNKPIIWHVINNVKTVKSINSIVIATSTEKNNDILIEEVKKYGVDVFVGSENDVLDRYYQAAKTFKADVIVRITADCPLIDSEVVERVIEVFKENKCDYASNTLPPSYPDGLDVEVFSFDTLEKTWKEAKQESEREHVTSYMKVGKNESKFKKINIKNKEDLSHIRLTLDYEEDFNLIKEIIERINKNQIHLSDILELIKKDPRLLNINNKFERNNGEKR